MKIKEFIVPDRYKGQVCIVTASSTGTGLAISKRLAQEGAIVIINSRSKANVQAAVESLKSMGLKNVDEGIVCNINIPEDRTNLIKYVGEKYGKIDILVLNAATNMYFGDLIDIPDSMFNKIIDSNIKSNFFLCKEAFPYLKKTESLANIIFISSFDVYNPRIPLAPKLGAYLISKTALHQMTHFLAADLRKYNIRVNCIASGSLETKFSDTLRKSLNEKGLAFKEIYGVRHGQPEDISNVIAFICSEEAEYINGEIIVVAGYPSSRL